MRNAECGMRSAECGVRSAECGVRSAECGVRSAECGVRNAESPCTAGTQRSAFHSDSTVSEVRAAKLKSTTVRYTLKSTGTE